MKHSAAERPFFSVWELAKNKLAEISTVFFFDKVYLNTAFCFETKRISDFSANFAEKKKQYLT